MVVEWMKTILKIISNTTNTTVPENTEVVSQIGYFMIILLSNFCDIRYIETYMFCYKKVINLNNNGCILSNVVQCLITFNGYLEIITNNIKHQIFTNFQK